MLQEAWVRSPGQGTKIPYTACLFGHWVASNSFLIPWTVAHQAPLAMGFPSKSTGVSCHFLLQGNLPNPEIEPTSPALAGWVLSHWDTEEAPCRLNDFLDDMAGSGQPPKTAKSETTWPFSLCHPHPPPLHPRICPVSLLTHSVDQSKSQGQPRFKVKKWTL